MECVCGFWSSLWIPEHNKVVIGLEFISAHGYGDCEYDGYRIAGLRDRPPPISWRIKGECRAFSWDKFHEWGNGHALLWRGQSRIYAVSHGHVPDSEGQQLNPTWKTLSLNYERSSLILVEVPEYAFRHVTSVFVEHSTLMRTWRRSLSLIILARKVSRGFSVSPSIGSVHVSVVFCIARNTPFLGQIGVSFPPLLSSFTTSWKMAVQEHNTRSLVVNDANCPKLKDMTLLFDSVSVTLCRDRSPG